MKAIVQERYGAPGEVLQLEEVEPPPVEGSDVLVRVEAAAVAGDDWHLMRGQPLVARGATGLLRPRQRVPRADVAGRVEAVGEEVTRFEVGDAVLGFDGGFAEYVAMPEEALEPRPENVSAAEAAAVPVSALTALQALRDSAEVQPGQHVLVVGASGGVGTFAVQLAKVLGAEVTGVCSAPNVELVRSLGADHVVDYTTADVASGDVRYDVIVDLVGNRSLADLRRALAPKGTLVLVGGTGGRILKGMDRWLRALLLSPFVGQRLRPLIHDDRPEDLAELRQLLAEGRLRAVIEATYPLAEVPRAVEHFAAGHGRGKVVVSV